jgi:excisionase family DNA binding protein
MSRFANERQWTLDLPAASSAAKGSPRVMLTPREAAKRVGVSVSLIYAWVEARLIPHYRAGLRGRGGKILIAEGDLLTFWESLKVHVAPAERPRTAQPKARIKFRHLKF